jgi:hypothetical protein
MILLFFASLMRRARVTLGRSFLRARRAAVDSSSSALEVPLSLLSSGMRLSSFLPLLS